VFVATNLNSGDVNTEVQGGKFSKFFVGGALVKAGSAEMGTVTVTVSGGEFANRIYGAGYAYGTDAVTELSAENSVITISGGTVNDGVFGGAHARKNAHVLVDAVDINISGGTFKDIFGGGWAEQGSTSTVTSATIDMSAGFAEYIFAGGANGSDSASINGSEAAAASGDAAPAVAISLTGSADADYIFLSSKHANSKVYGDVTLTISDCDSDKGFEFTRISGMAGCGVDNTSGTTKVVLESNLSLDYLDFVDELQIAEGCTLNINEKLLVEYNNEMIVRLALDGDDTNNGDWTVMSGAALNDSWQLGHVKFMLGDSELEFATGGEGLFKETDENGNVIAIKYGQLS
jgi:hypothetical protein